MTTQLFRRAAVLTAAAITLSALSSPARAADPTPAELSAAWLTGELTDGLVHNDQYAFDDIGLTIDVGLALNAIGSQPAAVAQLRAAVAPEIKGYTTYKKSVFAASTAKALVLAQTLGASPRSFGGVNLVKQLQQRVSLADTPIRGRIADKSRGADYANVVGQAYAVQGLAAARSRKAGAVLDFFLEQQCDAGYFRLNFTPNKNRRDQTCDGGTKAQSPADTDVTALAVITLVGLDSSRPKVQRAATRAVRWLKHRQRANGSFGGGPTTPGSNTNSTGLAATALGLVGACKPARQAAEWVLALQIPAATPGLEAQAGAIAYDRGAYDAVVAAGDITIDDQDQWRRATAQAAPALLRLAAPCKGF